MTAGLASPQRVLLIGRLDMLRASDRAFVLKLDDGSDVAGVLTRDAVEAVAPLLNQRVMIVGTASSDPTGGLRVEADRLSAADKGGVAAVVGKWPGDETDEQVDDALRATS